MEYKPGKMIKEIEVYDGKGVLDLKGSPGEAVLFIRNQPRIASFLAELGTVWRYLVGEEINEDIIMANYEYENLVRDGNVDFSLSLSKQFHHILRLLANGKYKLQYLEVSHEIKVLPAIGKNSSKLYYDVYGGDFNAIATQTFLNSTVVEDYKGKISDGFRPIVVLFRIRDSWSEFIVDGHHRIQAYKQLMRNPTVLIISKLDCKAINIDRGIEILKTIGLDDEKVVSYYREERE